MAESNFQFSAEEIKALIDICKESGIKPVAMRGVHTDLQTLKPVIEKMYDEHIFYLSYFACDASYMGWTREEINEMLKITDGITEKFYEIYALILTGLGIDWSDEYGT